MGTVPTEAFNLSRLACLLPPTSAYKCIRLRINVFNTYQIMAMWEYSSSLLWTLQFYERKITCFNDAFGNEISVIKCALPLDFFNQISTRGC